MVKKKVTTKTITTEEVEGNILADKKVVVKKKRNSNRKNFVKNNELSFKLENQLIENFVSLQKVLTSLSFKFDDMTKKLSEVLDLFEESAKAFVKKDVPKEQSSVVWQKEVLEKIDNLFEQNKILARGLTLIHEEAIKSENPPSPPIMNVIPMVPVPPRGEMIRNPMRTGIADRVESASLMPKPRIKEEGTNFNLQESPFSLKK